MTDARASADAAANSEQQAAVSVTAAQNAVNGFGLQAGTTTTGEPGTDAAVEIQKAGIKYTANFTIPRGEKGADGAPGKADAANTPDVILIYGFYSNDLQDSYTGTKPATDLSKIAAAYKAKFDELKAKYPNARIIYALQCMFQSDLTLSKSPITSGLPDGTGMTNAYKTLQSSERILFTSTSLGVGIMDCTDEVWALGKGLTVSDMVHPNADGAVKLGQILGRKLEQLLTQSTPTESPNLYVAPSLPQTIKGITFSDAGNGGIHCKGTGNGYAILPSDTLTLHAGTYSVSPNKDVYMGLFKGSMTIIDKSNPVKSIPAGNYTPKLVVVNGKPIDETVYPRLVRIDQ